MDVGTIRAIAYNPAGQVGGPPAGWLVCDGMVYGISQYQDLFNVIGNRFGGDGQTSFAVPQMQARTPMGSGITKLGPDYRLGQMRGDSDVNLTMANLPFHGHSLQGGRQAPMLSANAGTATAAGAGVNTLGAFADATLGAVNNVYNNLVPNFNVNAGPPLTGMIVPAGAGVDSVSVRQPGVNMYYIICFVDFNGAE